MSMTVGWVKVTLRSVAGIMHTKEGIIRAFHSNSNFAISLMVNLLNVNFVYYNIFRNLSMTAHITEIRKSKLANI